MQITLNLQYKINKQISLYGGKIVFTKNPHTHSNHHFTVNVNVTASVHFLSPR